MRNESTVAYAAEEAVIPSAESLENLKTNLIETNFPKQFDALKTAFLVVLPVVAVIAAPLYIHAAGFTWVDFGIFISMYLLTGLSITMGYHRYFSHRAFDSHPVIEFLLLFFGAGAIENSAKCWVSDHRYHHRHADHDGDPYNITKGFFWAHMGWIMHTDAPGYERTYSNIADLRKSRMFMLQDKYYWPLALFVSFGIPFLVGLAFGRPFGGLLWGGLIRLVIVHHATYLINSAAHMFGTRPYSDKNSARDSWWLAFFSFGEGFHNFHHSFPSDYRNAIRWHQWDPSKWIIATCSKLGLTWNLKRTSDESIARMKIKGLSANS